MTNKTIELNGHEIKLSGYRAGGNMYIKTAHDTQDELEFIALGLRSEGFEVKVRPVNDSQGTPIFWTLNAEAPAS